MKPIYKKIWKLALPYQDKRDDKGHAETVLHYALELLKDEKADENIVIPAAILHDIGWSQLSAEERFHSFVKNRGMKKEYAIRRKHENVGVKLAREVLKKADYNPNLKKEILEIISRHDTRHGFISKNEGIMRDADKLWRYSKTGFWLDVKRFKEPQKKWYENARKKIELQDFFYSKSGKNIALHELRRRKEEFK